MVASSVSAWPAREDRLEARVDGEHVVLPALVRACAVVCFEPGSHELISGAAEERRRFLDWGVFHVEHEFLARWRRYQRALRQRNARLRRGARCRQLEPWETEMADAGSRISAMRDALLGSVATAFWTKLLDAFLGELGAAELRFKPGGRTDSALAEALAARAASGIVERGFTGRGPHRADWSIVFASVRRAANICRAARKSCAHWPVILAQARLFAEQSGEWPDSVSRRSRFRARPRHQERVIDSPGERRRRSS